MASRTVRLDEEAESALREIRGATGMTASQALKSGLLMGIRACAVETPSAAYARRSGESTGSDT